MTTLGVGGPARYFAEAATPENVQQAIAFAKAHSLPVFVLGGGSNLVVADTGFNGLALKLAIRGIDESKQDGKVLFTAGAGEEWDRFVAHTVDCSCAGLECLSGIPGTVGATPVQNVGAYGQDVSETIHGVEALDLTTGETRTFTSAECGFAYRTSRFNSGDRGRYIVLRVTSALQPSGTPAIRYADLKKAFSDHEPTLTEVRQTVCEIRRSKGMLLVDGDADCRSAGSFFKNPVLSDTDYAQLQQRATRRGLTIPSYPALASQHKVPAAWLVEHSGFPKGHTCGPVGISTKHALALTNRGGARAADVIALKREIQRSVQKQFGIHLHPEPVFLGFEIGDL